jgi:cytochrome b pre-mRNA-processing protein 3
MSLLSRLLQPKAPPLMALWEAAVAEARQPIWYTKHAVADTVDGRFDMVALVTALVLLRLEREEQRQETAWLTERFVDDMDGSLRQIGIGDMVIGKHVGKAVGALGGRLGAYRRALASADRQAAMADAIVRNVFRGDDADARAPGLADAALALDARIGAVPMAELLAGRLQ